MKTLLLGVMLAALSFALPFAQPATAQKIDELIEIGGDNPIKLRADRVYFLIRVNSVGVSPVFLRIPTDAEMALYDAAKLDAFKKAEPKLIKKREEAIAARDAAIAAATAYDKPIPPVPSVDNFDFVYTGVRNVQTLKMSKALEKVDKTRTLLVEAAPGTYVFYGIGFGQIFQTCLCLGTVSFTPEPGKITDLGTMLVARADIKSDIPELADATDLGPSMNGHIVSWSAAIRPVGVSDGVPALLSGKPIVPARYRATGKFVAGFAFNINRLAPIPGVLAYRYGDVIDPVTGKVVENQY